MYHTKVSGDIRSLWFVDDNGISAGIETVIADPRKVVGGAMEKFDGIGSSAEEIEDLTNGFIAFLHLLSFALPHA